MLWLAESRSSSGEAKSISIMFLQYGSLAGVPAIPGFSSPEGGICDISSGSQEATQSEEVCSYSESVTRTRKRVDTDSVDTDRCPHSLLQLCKESQSTVGLQRGKQMLFPDAGATWPSGSQHWNPMECLIS